MPGTHAEHPAISTTTPKPMTKPPTQMKTTTEYRCPECSAFCAESFDLHWLVCPRCSRISHDFKPPDFQHAGDWDFPDAEGVELAMTLSFGSLTEHACEH